MEQEMSIENIAKLQEFIDCYGLHQVLRGLDSCLVDMSNEARDYKEASRYATWGKQLLQLADQIEG